MCVCVCICVFVCVCMCDYVCVCVCVCMYKVYTHKQTFFVTASREAVCNFEVI